jgi:hypothetical protein
MPIVVGLVKAPIFVLVYLNYFHILQYSWSDYGVASNLSYGISSRKVFPLLLLGDNNYYSIQWFLTMNNSEGNEQHFWAYLICSEFWAGIGIIGSYRNVIFGSVFCDTIRSHFYFTLLDTIRSSFNFESHRYDTIQFLFCSKYQKAVRRFSSRHHPSFNLVVLRLNPTTFIFRVFTSGLLKCDFLELNKKFLRLFSNLYCILKFNLGGVGIWRAKTLKLGGFWQF